MHPPWALQDPSQALLAVTSRKAGDRVRCDRPALWVAALLVWQQGELSASQRCGHPAVPALLASSCQGAQRFTGPCASCVLSLRMCFCSLKIVLQKVRFLLL